jgi:hypothetical protein
MIYNFLSTIKSESKIEVNDLRLLIPHAILSIQRFFLNLSLLEFRPKTNAYVDLIDYYS